MNFDHLRLAMHQQGIDAWLIYDFRGSNGVFARLFPPPAGSKRHTTRRIFALIPARGQPTLLVHGLDAGQFSPGPAGFQTRQYAGWRDLHAWLAEVIGSAGPRLAMEYSPGCSLPVMGIVDAGTIELLRALGAEVVSSANLVQASAAVWGGPEPRRQHAVASEKTITIVDAAFDFIRQRTRAKATVSEREVHDMIRAQFVSAGLEYPDGPIVAVNEHAGDPHFEVPATGSSLIKPGDWVLIDLWARVPGDHNIYSDITWTGYVPKASGDAVPARHRAVFEAVIKARDASFDRAVRAWRFGPDGHAGTVQGWELDDAARDALHAAGFASMIRHRTGHSLSPGPLVHGLGMNLDNLETHDTRHMLPDTGFTIEPGLYDPTPGGLGVRSEFNVYVDPANGPEITGRIQREPVII